MPTVASARVFVDCNARGAIINNTTFRIECSVIPSFPLDGLEDFSDKLHERLLHGRWQAVSHVDGGIELRQVQPIQKHILIRRLTRTRFVAAIAFLEGGEGSRYERFRVVFDLLQIPNGYISVEMTVTVWEDLVGANNFFDTSQFGQDQVLFVAETAIRRFASDQERDLNNLRSDMANGRPVDPNLVAVIVRSPTPLDTFDVANRFMENILMYLLPETHIDAAGPHPQNFDYYDSDREIVTANGASQLVRTTQVVPKHMVPLYVE